jgi:hypothetical protein
MLRGLILFVFAYCLAYPAWGAEAAKKDAKAKPEPGTSVEMPFLVAPMSKDGDLLGYAYIASKLVCSSPPACIAVREKLAFIQDGFVREVNLKPISLASDPKEVDKDLLNSRLTAVAKRIVGGDRVRGMLFMEVKFSPLHPSDSTPMPAQPEQAAASGTPATGAENGAGAAKNGTAAGATSKPGSGPSH